MSNNIPVTAVDFSVPLGLRRVNPPVKHHLQWSNSIQIIEIQSLHKKF